MRIGISVLGLVPGRVGGSETYVRNLLAHMVAGYREDEIWLWADIQGYRTFADLDNQHIRRLVSGGLAIPGSEWLERSLFRVMRRLGVLKHLSGPTSCCASTGVDVFHFPFPYSIGGVQVEKVPVVTTVYDLQHEVFPQLFTAQHLSWRRETLGEVIQRSAYIITISDFTRRQLLSMGGLSESRVKTVWLGVNAGAFGTVDSTESARVRKVYSLPRQYLFYPATTWHHKNHGKLLEVMEILVSLGWADIALMLTGTERNAHESIMRRIHDLGLEHRVFWLGHVPERDLAALYKGASLLVFPSRFEGFGLPVLEAMAAGCPVACSNTTALPEIAGDAALLFDPNDVEAIAAAIVRLLEDSALKQRLIGRGSNRVAMFSWGETVRKTRRIYLEVQALAGVAV